MKTRSSISVTNMAKNPLYKDSSNMEDIMNRIGADHDIWQNEAVYMIARAVWDSINYILKKDGKPVCYDCEMRYDCFPGESVPPCMKGAR